MHRKPRESKGYIAMVARSKVPGGEDEDKLTAAGGQSNHEEDKQALLLEHVGLVETLNGWHDGILAIGTFGFDEIMVEEDDADVFEPTLGRDEAKTRELLKATAGFARRKDETINVLGSKPQVGLGSADGDDYETHRLSLLQHPQEDSILEVETKSEMKEERTRTTLADLFSRHDVHDEPSAESGEKKDAGARDGGKKPTCCVKPGEAAAKAAAAAGSKGEETGASAKIQKLMAKMMKRKIHPEAENYTGPKGAGKVKEIQECATVYQEADGSSSRKYAMLGGSTQRSKKSWMNKISVI
ncbi:protein TILLER ANGLE CONTROL 1 isoform X2 [Nymphaea colorata]|nr:protein TILLER ANGLE CONTROL 1 isoform X2 [Nymphaea colorata]